VSREAIKLALESLDIIRASCSAGRMVHADNEAKIAEHILRQALEQEQGPVAWASTLDFDDDDIEIIPAKAKGKLGTSNCDIPLYTAPPKREWVGLTDEEVAQSLKESWVTEQAWQSAVWWAEAKLKEKNG
jgi:hypothetical protein